VRELVKADVIPVGRFLEAAHQGGRRDHDRSPGVRDAGELGGTDDEVTIEGVGINQYFGDARPPIATPAGAQSGGGCGDQQTQFVVELHLYSSDAPIREELGDVRVEGRSDRARQAAIMRPRAGNVAPRSEGQSRR
jgi:hypothetical protein